MSLKQHYDELYQTSVKQYKSDAYQIDNLIDSTTDKRYGVTLLIRPPKKVKSEIKKLLDELQSQEPEQYFYPESDIHITVMSIISCYDGFDISQINVASYAAVIHKCLEELFSFDIIFKGLTLSPSCLMVQGFFSDKTLSEIRENLRIHFKSSNLQHSIDKRYTIQTAHATIFRLRENLRNPHKFLETVAKYKNHEFGVFTVSSLELVTNDWYQRQERVQKLNEFNLKC
ncbi:mutarotase [Wenyingzhuangia sp. 1_MG-2023]|nr:mutarotase [Wenyingzhuangia sp. 1_MG-2023]